MDGTEGREVDGSGTVVAGSRKGRQTGSLLQMHALTPHTDTHTYAHNYAY